MAEDEEVPACYIDPLSLAVMSEPVVLLETRQRYDLQTLLEWFEKGGKRDPLTNTPLPEKITLRRDTALKAEIHEWADAHPSNAEAAQALRAMRNTRALLRRVSCGQRPPVLRRLWRDTLRVVRHLVEPQRLYDNI